MKYLEELIFRLKKRKQTIAVAESCTGGYLSYLFTKVPGSSKVFKLGVVVYSISAKEKLLLIPPSLLKGNEGVSEEVAKFLAINVRKILNTNLGASVVGFAGPQAKKGMRGTVFMAVADKNCARVKEEKINGDRDTVRRKASYSLIKFVLQIIKH